MVLQMSKRRDDDKWGPHSHCVVCGVATPENEKYCSAVCEAKYNQEAEKYKRQQKMSYIFIGIMGVLVILMFALPYLIPGLFS